VQEPSGYSASSIEKFNFDRRVKWRATSTSLISVSPVISALPGYRLPYQGPTFNEFLVEGPRPAAPMIRDLAGRGILAGVPLSRFGGATNQFLVAVTEMNTREEMDRLVSVLAEAGGRQ